MSEERARARKRGGAEREKTLLTSELWGFFVGALGNSLPPLPSWAECACYLLPSLPPPPPARSRSRSLSTSLSLSPPKNTHPLRSSLVSQAECAPHTRRYQRVFTSVACSMG
jgi:hypothetical protein